MMSLPWQMQIGNAVLLQHTFQRKQQQLQFRPALLIALLLFMQNIEMHVCRQLIGMDAGVAGQVTDAELALGNSYRGTAAAEIIHEKRAPDSGGNGARLISQPEEIFSAPTEGGREIEMNYDSEYPMVVPKRAALLLDRLMVALHHALEHERGGHRISDFYANQRGEPKSINAQASKAKDKVTDSNSNSNNNDYDGSSSSSSSNANANANAHNANSNANSHMYSDDDPNVMLDYDFKDLNSINRATGETLMAKSFQRRSNAGNGNGNGFGDGDGNGSGKGTEDHSVAMLTKGAPLSLDSGGGGAGGGRSYNVGAGGGRMYWRCYFNAVSCF